MTLAPDGLPISEIGEIDAAILRRIGSYMSASRAPVASQPITSLMRFNR